MTRNDIIKWARLVGFSPEASQSPMLDRFAELVASAEREACISIAKQWDADHPTSNYGACIARLISARGQA